MFTIDLTLTNVWLLALCVPYLKKHQMAKHFWPLQEAHNIHTPNKSSKNFFNNMEDLPRTISMFFEKIHADKGTFEAALWKKPKPAAWYIRAEHVKLLWLQWTQFSRLYN